jgi:CDP-4-dehydro-6-deoxyglucose reductase
MKEEDKLILYEYRIQSQEKLSGNVFRIFMLPIHNILHYQAGQYLKVRYPNGLFLPFSIANAPDSEGMVELHIRCYENDLDTQVFIEEILNQQKIWCTGPYGHSYYRSNMALPILLLGAGTGFAPCKAIVEALFNASFAHRIHLYWGVRHSEDFYLPNLPLLWQKLHRNFVFTPVISQSFEKNWYGKRGYVTHWVVEDYPNLADFQIYLFGSLQMATVAEKLFIEHGLPREHLFSDMLLFEANSG